MKKSDILEIRLYLYDVYFPEEDIIGAKWLEGHVKNNSVVYVDYGMSISIIKDYTALNEKNLYIINEMSYKPESYIYLRSLNVLEGKLTSSIGGHFNLSNVFPSQVGDSIIYSNGKSEVYFHY
jgi:uncharacterized membrane protein